MSLHGLGEFRCGLGQFADIFWVTPQHEVLLMPAHHQHAAGQSGIAGLF
jgi:hypothetical protein